jgi:DNA primase
MPYISQDTIEAVMEVDIVDVINSFVSLKKRGANYIGSCPFHDEKTPSFTVSKAKGIYKCFGCGKAGHNVRFIMEHENLEFFEAVEYIANSHGIIVEYEGTDIEEYKQKKSRQESLFDLNSLTQQFYKTILMNSPAPLNYLLYERKFTPEIIRKYGLGSAPNSKTALLDYISNSSPSLIPDAKELGLILDGYSGPVDRFHSRIMFPLHNLKGDIVGFSGRQFSESGLDDKKQAKYLNSPESEIFSKSNILYGFYQNKNAIRKAGLVFLEEGYTDVMTSDQVGLMDNGLPAVGTMGTSLTIE